MVHCHGMSLEWKCEHSPALILQYGIHLDLMHHEAKQRGGGTGPQQRTDLEDTFKSCVVLI